MSHSSSMKRHESIDIEDIAVHHTSDYLNDELKIYDDSSNSLLNDSNELSSQENPNRHVVKSCFSSTIIFSINFISSILVINLSKW